MSYQRWQYYLAASEQGLLRIGLVKESFGAVQQWIQRHVPEARLVEDSSRMAPYTRQLLEYFRGHRRQFDVPLDLRGTPFQMMVWQELKRIPFGETASYQDIAQSIGRPHAVRAVGAANGANPIPIVIPCHRVIGKNGHLTGYHGGMDIKIALLQLEGLVIEQGSSKIYPS